MTASNLPRVTPTGATARLRRQVPRPAGVRPRVGPRLLLRGALVGLALLVLVLLLAGCGGPELPAAAPATTPAPTTTAAPAPSAGTTAPSPTPSRDSATATPSPTGTPGPHAAPGGGAADGSGTATGAPAPHGAGAAPAASPLWPAGDAATARRMQEQADAGGDPWLLDPQEVTLSYVGSELGFRNPGVTEVGPGRFAVTDGRSPAKATVGLEQTVRTGDGGIWLVTHVERY